MSAKLRVLSPAFQNCEPIPPQYACNSSSNSPPLVVDNIPSGTKTLALVVEDPDAPSGIFDYWIAWNIPPLGRINDQSNRGVQGLNSMAEHSFMAPCPTEGTHNYHFKIYALDTMLNLDANSGKRELVTAMKGHILAQGELIGLYTRAKPAETKTRRRTTRAKTTSRKTADQKTKGARTKKSSIREAAAR